MNATENPHQLLTDEQYVNTPEAMNNLWAEANQGSFKGINDVEIHYRKLLQQDRNKAVVIASGRTETFDQYRETAFNFFQQGYSVFIHDHRGQGYSGRMTQDPEKGHIDQFENYVADLKTFFDTQVRPEQFQNRFLLAHSMGGAIASLYLQEHPKDFHAAALSAPMHEVDTGAFGRAACFIAKTAESISKLTSSESTYLLTQKPYQVKPFEPETHTSLTHSADRYNDKLRLMAENPHLRLGGITNRWLLEACRIKDKIIQQVDRIEVPVLLLQAGVDQVVTAAGQNHFCQSLADAGKVECEGGKPLVIDGGFHELLQETDAYRLPTMTAIFDFFGKLTEAKTR